MAQNFPFGPSAGSALLCPFPQLEQDALCHRCFASRFVNLDRIKRRVLPLSSSFFDHHHLAPLASKPVSFDSQTLSMSRKSSSTSMSGRSIFGTVPFVTPASQPTYGSVDNQLAALGRVVFQTQDALRARIVVGSRTSDRFYVRNSAADMDIMAENQRLRARADSLQRRIDAQDRMIERLAAATGLEHVVEQHSSPVRDENPRRLQCEDSTMDVATANLDELRRDLSGPEFERRLALAKKAIWAKRYMRQQESRKRQRDEEEEEEKEEEDGKSNKKRKMSDVPEATQATTIRRTSRTPRPTALLTRDVLSIPRDPHPAPPLPRGSTSAPTFPAYSSMGHLDVFESADPSAKYYLDSATGAIRARPPVDGSATTPPQEITYSEPRMFTTSSGVVLSIYTPITSSTSSDSSSTSGDEPSNQSLSSSFLAIMKFWGKKGRD